MNQDRQDIEIYLDEIKRIAGNDPGLIKEIIPLIDITRNTLSRKLLSGANVEVEKIGNLFPVNKNN